MKHILLLSLLALPVLVWGQYPFQKMTQAVGITDTVGGSPAPNTPLWGTGVSTADFNNDGFDDITVATGLGRNSLFYQNNGDGTFTKLAAPVQYPYETKSVLWADIDNDGDKDLFMAGWKKPNRLYRNDGNWNFTDITVAAGISVAFDWTWGASFGDYNNDGFLDLYICQRRDKNYANSLYRNNGDGTFTDVSAGSGANDGFQLTFDATFLDYNQDGFQDLYMANDRDYGNSMYENDGNGMTFTSVGGSNGSGITIDAMNTGIGDYNNDGWDDIYVTNTPNGGNSLLEYDPVSGTYTDVADDAGVRFFDFTWAGNFFDYDNDTDQDLYVSCMSSRPQDPPSYLYHNLLVEQGLDSFSIPFPQGLPGDTISSFSHAIADFNNDGFLDFVVPNNGSDTIHLYQNTLSGNGNNWVKMDLEGVVSNRDAVGTRVVMKFGNTEIMRYKHLGEAYLCQNADKLHFGVGDATAIDSIFVTWLSGIVDTMVNVSTNQCIFLRENDTNALGFLCDIADASCYGEADGSATVEATGGDGSYTYTWSNGMTGNSISGLTAGIYYVTATDASNFGVKMVTVSQPTELTVTAVPTHTSGGMDGSVETTVLGGTMPYGYSWSNGDTAEDPTGLAPGLYELTVTDGIGCSEEALAAIYDGSSACNAPLPIRIEPSYFSATVAWEAVPGATVYRVRYREVGTTGYSSLNTTNTFAELTGLADNTDYEFNILAKCSGTSPWSPDYTFTTLMNDGSVCASWSPSEVITGTTTADIGIVAHPDASRFRVRYNEAGSSNYSYGVSNTLTMSLTGLTGNTMYEYQTSSRCPDGWTAWSSTTYMFNTSSLDNPGSQAPITLGDHTFLIQDGLMLELTPNPVAVTLEVNILQGTPTAMFVRNANGQLVEEVGQVEGTTFVEVSHLVPGIYFIQVVDQDGHQSMHRFVKTN